MTEPLPKPRYRIVAEAPIFLNGAMVSPDAEVEFIGRPKPLELTPDNDMAGRVAAYYAKYGLDPHCPKTPWNAKHGTFFLPGVLPTWGSKAPLCDRSDIGRNILGAVADADAIEGMPKYTMTLHQFIGRRKFAPGDAVVCSSGGRPSTSRQRTPKRCRFLSISNRTKAIRSCSVRRGAATGRVSFCRACLSGSRLQ